MSRIYDCIIVGAGPAGLGAAIYTSRDRLKTLLLEKFSPGGQIVNTDRIENYPGFDRIDGPDLIMKMQAQATGFGAEIKNASEITALEKLDDGNIAVYAKKDKYISRAVILAPGSSYRKLGVPGEEEFRNAGAGVSYCGTCDAPFYRGKEVLSIGGGNTAIEETLHLAKFASKVTIIHRRDKFRATRVLVEELNQKANEKDSNLVIKYDTVATAILGERKVNAARLKNVKTNEEYDYLCDGVFVFIGMVPNTDFLKGFVELSEAGFIKCDCADLKTTVPSIFVAGDCRAGVAMQLVTAVAGGNKYLFFLKHD